jgi:hypothetical protein
MQAIDIEPLTPALFNGMSNMVNGSRYGPLATLFETNLAPFYTPCAIKGPFQPGNIISSFTSAASPGQTRRPPKVMVLTFLGLVESLTLKEPQYQGRKR